MFFTITCLVAASAALIVHKARAAGRAQANLGWMSTQWLAEHRSSHPS